MDNNNLYELFNRLHELSDVGNVEIGYYLRKGLSSDFKSVQSIFEFYQNMHILFNDWEIISKIGKQNILGEAYRLAVVKYNSATGGSALPDKSTYYTCINELMSKYKSVTAI